MSKSFPAFEDQGRVITFTKDDLDPLFFSSSLVPLRHIPGALHWIINLSDKRLDWFFKFNHTLEVFKNDDDEHRICIPDEKVSTLSIPPELVERFSLGECCDYIVWDGKDQIVKLFVPRKLLL